MKKMIFVGTGLFVLGIVIGLIQLWFAPWSPEIFVKLEITLGAIFVINLIVAFTYKEYADYRRQQSGDKLDD